MNPQDESGNTVLGNHCGERTKGCVIVAEEGQLVATVGVEDLLIVRDGNVTLVAARREEGDVKLLVEALKKRQLSAYL